MNLPSGPLVRRFGVAAMSALLAMVAGNEGRKYLEYEDIAGMATVCDGVTGVDVVAGKQYTDAECDALLLRQVRAHAEGALRCLTREPDPETAVAFLDLAYNIGVAAFCRSTLVERFNAGDHDGACRELRKWTWTHVNGRPVDCRTAGHLCPGIVLRRDREQQMCMGELPIPGLFDGVVGGVESAAKME